MVASTQSRRLPHSRVVAKPTPILIDLSLQCLIIKAGFVGQASAHQIMSLPQPTFDATSSTAEDYYHLYCPVLHQLLNYFSLTSFAERRIIVVFDSGLYLHKALQNALTRIVLEAIQCHSVAFFSAMQMISMSLMLPSQEATHLAIYLTDQEAQCIVSSSYHTLPFTYQATGQRTGMMNINNGPTKASNYWSSKEGSREIVVAILKCLEVCPRELRKAAIHNLYFCGSAASDIRSIRIGKQLQDALRSEGTTLLASSSSTLDENEETQPVLSDVGVSVPVTMSTLRPLANFVSLVAMPDSIRPDLAVWIGASIWANYVFNKDSESAVFQWRTTFK
jgi:hypothetical protein